MIETLSNMIAGPAAFAHGALAQVPSNWPISFAQPKWLWLALLIPLLIAVSIRSLAGLDPLRRVLSIVARCLVLLTIIACLARVEYVRSNDELTVIFLMDRSDSVKQREPEQEAYIAAVAEDIPKDDRLGMIDFAQDAYLQQLPMSGGYFLEQGRLPKMIKTERTDVAGAIRLAMAMFPEDTSKRIVLMSDGNDNMGDVLKEAELAAADGTVIDVLPIRYSRPSEVFFDRMIAPTRAEEGEQIPIRLNIVSLGSKPVTGRIEMSHNGRKVALPEEVSRVQLQPGNNPLIIKMPVNSGGAQRFSAEFVPDDQESDVIYDNNRATTFSFVAGKGRVLILSSNPQYDMPLYTALRSENVNVELEFAETFVIDPLSLLEYNAIILANIPANIFTDEQQQLLATYVRDSGGGLIMTGGDEAFGAGGWIGSPVEAVMPVHFEIKHKRIIPRGALAIIMHSCEIARGNEYGVEVAKKSVDTISSRDYFGILAFSGFGVNWDVPMQIAYNKSAVKNQIDRMTIGDMPSFAPAMDLALKAFQATDAAQKHMIIISDGDPQPPTPTTIKGLIEEGVTVSTVGIGYGQHVMDQSLIDIANQTGGKFYACRNPRLLPQIFAKESKVVRRPLIIEDPFIPQQFHTMSELLTGVSSREELPALGGLILTSPKEDPRVQMPLIRPTDDGNDPVLAHWQEGLGKSVAFTSGYWPKWGGDWVAWPKFAKFWAQLVRWSMRQDASADFDTYTVVEGSNARVVVEALDKDAGFLNFLNFNAGVVQPDGKSMPIAFQQTGPGHYEAEFPVDQSGQYITNIGVNDGGQSRGMIHAGLSIPYSPEYRELSTNESLLRRVADTSGGRVLEMDPATDDVFNHNLPPSIARHDIWEDVLKWILLPLFLLDVAVRRLASWVAFSVFVEVILLAVMLFGLGYIHEPWWSILGVLLMVHAIGWLIRWQSFIPMVEFFTHSVTALGRAGERSTVALDQLKTTRDRVRDEIKAPGQSRPAEPAEAAPDRSVKFDVAGKQADVPVKDMKEALGAADIAKAAAEPKRKPAGADKPADEGDVTSRLLKAKRRARDEFEGKEKDQP